MKVRVCFVSNSSSSSFIIIAKNVPDGFIYSNNEEVMEWVAELMNRRDSSEGYKVVAIQDVEYGEDTVEQAESLAKQLLDLAGIKDYKFIWSE